MNDKALEPIAEKLADWVIWAQGGVPTETQSRARKASLLSHIMPALREVAEEARREEAAEWERLRGAIVMLREQLEDLDDRAWTPDERDARAILIALRGEGEK